MTGVSSSWSSVIYRGRARPVWPKVGKWSAKPICFWAKRTLPAVAVGSGSMPRLPYTASVSSVQLSGAIVNISGGRVSRLS